jgi:lysophospholipase L1-like esterase
VFVLPWYCAAAELNPLVRRLRAAMRERFPRGTVLGVAAPAKGAEAADPETGRTAEPPVWFLDFEPVFPRGGEAELAALRRKYFIWDGVHPTADTYELLGKYAGQVFAGF